MHSVWIFPNGWGCHTQHDTDYTAANLPSNLMHSWSTGSNQFSAFTVWWIWPTSYDLGPLCYKYGHAFSAVYKTYGRNPSRGCFMQQTSMGLCCMNSIAYHAYRDGWIEELLLWAVAPKVLLPIYQTFMRDWYEHMQTLISVFHLFAFICLIFLQLLLPVINDAVYPHSKASSPPRDDTLPTCQVAASPPSPACTILRCHTDSPSTL